MSGGRLRLQKEPLSPNRGEFDFTTRCRNDRRGDLRHQVQRFRSLARTIGTVHSDQWPFNLVITCRLHDDFSIEDFNILERLFFLNWRWCNLNRLRWSLFDFILEEKNTSLSPSPMRICSCSCLIKAVMECFQRSKNLLET